MNTYTYSCVNTHIAIQTHAYAHNIAHAPQPIIYTHIFTYIFTHSSMNACWIKSHCKWRAMHVLFMISHYFAHRVHNFHKRWLANWNIHSIFHGWGLWGSCFSFSHSPWRFSYKSEGHRSWESISSKCLEDKSMELV